MGGGLPADGFYRFAVLSGVGLVEGVFAFPALLVDVFDVAERCHCHIIHSLRVDQWLMFESPRNVSGEGLSRA